MRRFPSPPNGRLAEVVTGTLISSLIWSTLSRRMMRTAIASVIVCLLLCAPLLFCFGARLHFVPEWHLLGPWAAPLVLDW